MEVFNLEKQRLVEHQFMTDQLLQERFFLRSQLVLWWVFIVNGEFHKGLGQSFAFRVNQEFLAVLPYCINPNFVKYY